MASSAPRRVRRGAVGCQPLPQLGPTPAAALVLHRDGQGAPLADQHHQPVAPGQPGVEQVAGGFCQISCQTRRREVKAKFSLRHFENSERTGGTTEVKQATAAGRDVLVVARAGMEEVAELVIAATEALC